MRCCLIKSALNLHEFPEQKYKHWIKPGEILVSLTKLKVFTEEILDFSFYFSTNQKLELIYQCEKAFDLID